MRTSGYPPAAAGAASAPVAADGSRPLRSPAGRPWPARTTRMLPQARPASEASAAPRHSPASDRAAARLPVPDEQDRHAASPAIARSSADRNRAAVAALEGRDVIAQREVE